MSRGEQGVQGERGVQGEQGVQGERGGQGNQGNPAPIHPWRWRALAIWCVAFTLMTAWGFHELQRLADRNAKAREVLCARQHQLRAQVDRSIQYLHDIRTGERTAIVGLTEADILTSIKEDRAVIVAYNKLDCPDE